MICMALVRCNLSSGRVKLPDSVTYTGNVHGGHSGAKTLDTGGMNELYAKDTITIPTLGYHKADIAVSGYDAKRSSLPLGTGNNIDISSIDQITMSIATNTMSKNWHTAYQYYFGNSDSTYTVVLHN